MPTTPDVEEDPVEDLSSFLWSGTSPYHAVAEAARRLAEAGFTELDPAAEWGRELARGVDRAYVVRGGALVAWSAPPDTGPARPFRIVGAHTDSPNLRVKPNPDTGSAGWRQVAVEVYGGALWNSWLDRDLGLSGRVAVRDGTGVATRLLRVDDALLRVPQLAIHLDRDVNGQGLKLNPQLHLTPVWGVGGTHAGDFAEFVAEHLDVDPADVRGWDLMVHDLARPARLGRDGELLASARLDNLVSCWAALRALSGTAAGTGASDDPPSDPAAAGPAVRVVCLFDHEEVGSESATGASGALLAQVLERVVTARGGGRDDLLRALAGSVCASADMAHATHPNYPERHDPGHQVAIGGGPVVKVNVSQRYATEGATAALLVEACDRAGVPHQWFVSRNDQPCGSTIGPLTAAGLGIPTVDVGVAQLSMHSARELCAADDPARLAAALGQFLAG